MVLLCIHIELNGGFMNIYVHLFLFAVTGCAQAASSTPSSSNSNENREISKGKQATYSRPTSPGTNKSIMPTSRPTSPLAGVAPLISRQAPSPSKQQIGCLDLASVASGSEVPLVLRPTSPNDLRKIMQTNLLKHYLTCPECNKIAWTKESSRFTDKSVAQTMAKNPCMACRTGVWTFPIKDNPTKIKVVFQTPCTKCGIRLESRTQLANDYTAEEKINTLKDGFRTSSTICGKCSK